MCLQVNKHDILACIVIIRKRKFEATLFDSRSTIGRSFDGSASFYRYVRVRHDARRCLREHSYRALATLIHIDPRRVLTVAYPRLSNANEIAFLLRQKSTI